MQAEDKILLFTVHVCSGDFMRVFLKTPFVMFVFTIPSSCGLPCLCPAKSANTFVQAPEKEHGIGPWMGEMKPI